jgi:phosphatidylglycerol lysyltransferase
MFQLVVPSEILAITGVGIGTLYLGLRRSRLSRVAPSYSSNNESEATRYQSEYGYNEHAFIAAAVQPELWQDPVGKGAVSYVESGKIWMVGGEPLADESDLKSLTARFLAHAASKRKIVAFLPTTERFAQTASALPDVRIIKVGASPYFDLTKWNPRGNSAKKLRLGCNRARRAGIVIEQVCAITPEFKTEVDELSRRWSEGRRAGVKFGWLFEVMPFQNEVARRYFTARQPDGRLVGLLSASPIPARSGWYLEDVLRDIDAPDGTSDLLVFEALNRLAQSGAQLATLGTVPLSTKGGDGLTVGNNYLIEKAFGLARRSMRRMYSFDGLGCFKSKFVPCWWENEYVIVTKGQIIPPRVANALFNVLLPGGVVQAARILLSNHGA